MMCVSGDDFGNRSSLQDVRQFLPWAVLNNLYFWVITLMAIIKDDSVMTQTAESYFDLFFGADKLYPQQRNSTAASVAKSKAA